VAYRPPCVLARAVLRAVDQICALLDLAEASGNPRLSTPIAREHSGETAVRASNQLQPALCWRRVEDCTWIILQDFDPGLLCRRQFSAACCVGDCPRSAKMKLLVRFDDDLVHGRTLAEAEKRPVRGVANRDDAFAPVAWTGLMAEAAVVGRRIR